MPSDLLSLADASSILGVSSERVRQLVVAGDLPAQRFGNAWAVPMDAVVALHHASRSGGRPLGAVRAWSEVVRGDVDLGRPGRYRGRADVVRCEMSRADVESLPAAGGALLGGVRAAVAFGAPLVAADDHDLYLSRSAFAQLESLVAFVPDPLGPVRLRVVDDDAWGMISGGELAPRGAVALDLLDSADPRHWLAAEELVGNARRTGGSFAAARRSTTRAPLLMPVGYLDSSRYSIASRSHLDRPGDRPRTSGRSRDSSARDRRALVAGCRVDGGRDPPGLPVSLCGRHSGVPRLRSDRGREASRERVWRGVAQGFAWYRPIPSGGGFSVRIAPPTRTMCPTGCVVRIKRLTCGS
jgi:hypothetical protein